MPRHCKQKQQAESKTGIHRRRQCKQIKYAECKTEIHRQSTQSMQTAEVRRMQNKNMLKETGNYNNNKKILMQNAKKKIC